MSMHRIRLGKPWNRKSDAGSVRWQRNFGRPSNLGPKERVWVVVEGIRGRGSVVLNGQSLGRLSGKAAPGRFEVTGKLRPRNEILICLESAGIQKDAAGADPPGQVRLEIEAC